MRKHLHKGNNPLHRKDAKYAKKIKIEKDLLMDIEEIGSQIIGTAI